MRRRDYNIRRTSTMKATNKVFFVAVRDPKPKAANLSRENTIRKFEVIPDVPKESRGQCGQSCIADASNGTR